MLSSSTPFPLDVSSWDRNQIKHWLHLKGFSSEIQNKFYQETIDGETLLYLQETDLDTLLSATTITLGKKVKLRAYIEHLQSNPMNPRALLCSSHKTNMKHSPTSTSTHTNTNTNKSKSCTLSSIAKKHSPPNHVNIFDKFLVEVHDRYRNNINVSSSNSTFSTLSQIPSDHETSANIETIGEMTQINQLISVHKAVANEKHDRKRRRSHDDNQRSSKRMKISTNNEDDISLTCEQKESGRYAIRSHHYGAKTSRHILKQKILKEKQKHLDFVDKRQQIQKAADDMHKKDPYRYSRENHHDLSNVGKRWKPSELEIIWNLHYEKNWSNMQIAEKFRRTECGIMVQIDKIYKDKRATQELINKKYLYHKKVEAIKKGERKWCEKDHKWVRIKRDEDTDDDDDESSSSSDDDDDDDDDDEPIGIRMARVLIHKTEDIIGDKWDTNYIHNDIEIEMNHNRIIAMKTGEEHQSTALLQNKVSKGRHCWKFKFKCVSGTAPFYIGLHLCNKHMDLSHNIGKYAERAYVFNGYKACTNVYHADDRWSQDYSYGVRIRNEDIVSMEVDFNALTLRFAVNEVDLGIAHHIECDTYKAAVSISNKDTRIELLSYNTIIAYENGDDCTTADEMDENTTSNGLKYAELMHLL